MYQNLISAHAQRHATSPLVPASLGQGKDYFDEMFRDLTRETLYTQTRPKSGGLLDRLLDEPEPAQEPTQEPEKSPSPRAETPIERPPSARSLSERPPSSVYHDYTTTTSRYMSLVVRKPVFGVFNQVRHKPGCTATEDG